MDAFVTRKRRNRSPQSAAEPRRSPASAANDAHEESTEMKLAILSSLHQDLDQETLLDLLLAHDGDVDATSGALRAARLLQKPAAGSGVASQVSLRSFAVGAAASGSADACPAPKRARLLSRKGATLHLYDPRDVSEHTPCTLLLNFLPAEEANALLVELLEESKTFGRATFRLFDNVVSSPHTSGFYVASYRELQEQKDEYVYNGSRMTVRLPLNLSASPASAARILTTPPPECRTCGP